MTQRPPSAPWVARARLIEQILQPGIRLAIVQAGPGYGKSSLLAAVAEKFQGPTVRVQVSAFDADAVRFARTLAHAAAASGLSVDLGEVVRAAIRSSTPEEVGGLVAEQLGRVSEDVLVILDDVHLVDDSDTRRIVQGLVSAGAAGVRIVLATRTTIALERGRMIAYGQAVEINDEELAFTHSEIRRLADGFGLTLGDEQAAYLHAWSRGWPVATSLALQALTRPRQANPRPSLGQIEEFTRPLSEPSGAVFQLLAEEILEQESPAQQSFLLHTAVLANFSRSECTTLLGRDAGDRFDELAQQRLLRASRHPGEPAGVWRFHPLLRRFLLDRLGALAGVEEVAELHRGAARLRASQGRFDEAVEHARDAGDHALTADLIEAAGEGEIQEGHFATVLRWIGWLPVDVVDSRPELLRLRGEIRRFQGLFGAGSADLARAFEMFGQLGDLDSQADVACAMALLRSRTGNSSESILVLEQVLSGGHHSDRQTAEILRALSTSLREAGRAEEALVRGREAWDLVKTSPRTLANYRTMVRCSRTLTAVLVTHARFDEALQIVAECIDEHPWHTGADVEIGTALYCQALAQHGSGDLRGALQTLDRASSLVGTDVLILSDDMALLRGCILRDAGDLDAAESILRVLGPRGLADLALLQLMRGDRAGALRLSRERDSVAVVESLLELGRAEATLAIAQAANGLWEAAEWHLDRVESMLARRDLTYPLASLRLRRAAIALERGDEETATRILRRALGFAAQRALRNFLWWSSGVTVNLCAFAFSQDIEVDYVLELAGARFGPDEARILLREIQGTLGVSSADALVIVQQAEAPDLALLQAVSPLLEDCRDRQVKIYLRSLLARGLIARGAFEQLMDRRGLTWKELQLFFLYYVEPTLLGRDDIGNLRHVCATTLCISENTVRSHIKQIRAKLDLPGETGSLALRDWLIRQALVPTAANFVTAAAPIDAADPA